MNLVDFLKQSEGFNAIRLVGPLFSPGLATFSTELPTLYIDGGLNFKPAAPHLSFSVGDGDSSPLKPELLLNPEKDFSDLAYALDLLPSHFTKLHLEGFLGGRRDHEWINLGVVHKFLTERKMPTEVSFDRNQVRGFSAGERELDFQGTFSILCFDDTELSLKGMIKFPCAPKTNFPRFSSLGLSNEAFGKFKLQSAGAVFLLTN